MTLDDLVQSFREYTDNLIEPFLWTTEVVESYAVQAEIEACERRPLLTSSTDVDLCQTTVVSGTSLYTKPSDVREVYYAIVTLDQTVYHLQITNIDELSFMNPDWASVEGEPKYLLLTDNSFQIVPTPEEDGLLEISVSHIPKEPVSDTGEFTINEAHHYNLVYWMLHLAFEKRDADTFNAKRSLDYAQRFANIFGDKKSVNDLMGVRTVRANRGRGGWV